MRGVIAKAKLVTIDLLYEITYKGKIVFYKKKCFTRFTFLVFINNQKGLRGVTILTIIIIWLEI